MIKFVIYIILFFPLSLVGQEICQIDLYVLPWTFRIEGQLTDSLVRNYKGYTIATTIKDSHLIREFANSISLPTLYPDKISKRKFVPKVIIDVWIKYPQKEGGEMPFKREIMLNERQQILYEGVRYHRSDLLIAWLQSTSSLMKRE